MMLKALPAVTAIAIVGLAVQVEAPSPGNALEYIEAVRGVAAALSQPELSPIP